MTINLSKRKFMKVNFRIDTPIDEMKIEDNIIGKPIIVNKTPIGYISNAHMFGLYCYCEGLIWDRYFCEEYLIHEDSKSVEVSSIEIM